jgi:ribosome-binding factor A
MKSRRESLRAIASLCDSIGPEDGIDPRRSRRGGSRKKSTMKTRQLCKQVEIALYLAFAELGDDDLSELNVQRVEPAPDASRLLVVVTPLDPESDMTEAQALEALGGAEGLLRISVTAAIHRKRVPGLTFEFAPNTDGGYPPEAGP